MNDHIPQNTFGNETPAAHAASLWRDSRRGVSLSGEAWAHLMILDEQGEKLIHAHPEEAERASFHTHGISSAALAPPPPEIRMLTGFPKQKKGISHH